MNDLASAANRAAPPNARPPSNTRIIATYLIAGPLVGALAVLVAMGLQDPDTLWHSQFPALVGTAVVFSYPLGVFPALVAGIAHSVAVRRLQWGRARTVAAACACGVPAALMPALLLGDPSRIFVSVSWLPQFAMPSFVAALVLSLWLTRRAIDHGPAQPRR